MALAELERVEEVAEMRTYSAMAFSRVVQDCEWLIPQKTGEEYVNAYWVFAALITRDDIIWADFLSAFIELGGDGFYGAYQPAHLEPAFANLNRAVDDNPDRYPQFAGRLPRYEQGICPVWEKLHPRIIMLKTNYFDTAEIDRQAEIFEETIRRFS